MVSVVETAAVEETWVVLLGESETLLVVVDDDEAGATGEAEVVAAFCIAFESAFFSSSELDSLELDSSELLVFFILYSDEPSKSSIREIMVLSSSTSSS